MHNYFLKILSSIMIFVSLIGCGGWQLRGTDSLGEEKLSAYIDGGRVPSLTSALRAAFRARGITVTSNSKDAKILVSILSGDFKSRVLSLDPGSGKVRELEIQLSSEVVVRSKKNGLLMPRQTIRLQRDYFFDELAAEFTTMRSEIIERDLANDWAFAVVYRAVTSLKKNNRNN